MWKQKDKSKKYNQIKFTLGAILIIYTFMKNIKVKYHKIKNDTLLKSYDHAEFKWGAWKQIW